MDEIIMKLPAHAIRYLREMCVSERKYLSEMMNSTFGPSLAIQAAYDSLNAIESALPND